MFSDKALLARRVPEAIIVQVDPETILRVGQEPVAVAVHPMRDVLALQLRGS